MRDAPHAADLPLANPWHGSAAAQPAPHTPSYGWEADACGSSGVHVAAQLLGGCVYEAGVDRGNGSAPTPGTPGAPPPSPHLVFRATPEGLKLVRP